MEDEARAYFEAVEEHFLARVGRPLILSPADVEAVLAWWQEGVPLEAVRRGIDAHMERVEKDARRKRKARAVRFCDGEIRDAWEDLRAARLGDRRGDAAEDPARIERVLERAAVSLEEAARSAGAGGAAPLAGRLREAEADVRRMGALYRERAAGTDALEEELARLDAALLDAVRGSSPAEAEELREEAARRLADVRDRMEPRAFEKTRDALAEKLLRERHGLPRLSLYSY